MKIKYKTLYFLEEEEEFDIRIEVLKLKIRSLSELGKKIGYSTSTVSATLNGNRPYTKEFDKALKSIGINVIKIYDEEE